MKGNLTRRGERSWRLKYDVGSGANGERQTHYVALRGTKAAKILASLASGTHVDPSAETVAQFVERWLKDWADSNVSNKTFTRYAQLLRSTSPLASARHQFRNYAPLIYSTCMRQWPKTGFRTARACTPIAAY